MAIEPPHRALDRFQAGPDLGATVRRATPADRAGAGKMVVDLTAHRARLANDGIGQIVGTRGRGVHDDGQRRLERMREIAGMAPGLLGLLLIMLDEGVQLLDHRRDLVGHGVRHAVRLARAHRRDLLAQRLEPVGGPRHTVTAATNAMPLKSAWSAIVG